MIVPNLGKCEFFGILKGDGGSSNRFCLPAEKLSFWYFGNRVPLKPVINCCHMKSLNKTETYFHSFTYSLFPMTTFIEFIFKYNANEWLISGSCTPAFLDRAYLFVFRHIITKALLFKYIENFTTKKGKFPDKNSDIFSYFCSKHRLWVLVRTASARRF